METELEEYRRAPAPEIQVPVTNPITKSLQLPVDNEEPNSFPNQQEELRQVPGLPEKSPRQDRSLTPIATYEKTKSIKAREPPPEMILSLTSLYLRHIHPWLPFLDIQKVFTDIGLSNELSMTHHALFGISLPYSTDPRLDQKSCDEFWTFSKRRILLEILEEPSYNALEALTVLLLDLSGMTHGPQVLGPLSIAICNVANLSTSGNRGLKKSAADHSSRELSGIEQLHQSRLFWALYAIDTYVSITSGIPSCLRSSDIDRFLHNRDETWCPSMGTQHGSETISLPLRVFGYQLKLLDIARQIHQVYLHKPENDSAVEPLRWTQDFLTCSTLLCEWDGRLEQQLHYNLIPHIIEDGVAPAPVMMLHGYHHGLVIHLHTLSAFPPNNMIHAQVNEFSYESNRRCTASIITLDKLAAFLTDDVLDKMGWPFGWAIVVALRYILIQAHRYVEVDIMLMNRLLACLKALGRYWQVVKKYWRLLRQAMGELNITRQEEDGNIGNPALAAVTNLEISLSDLEDWHRPDPIINTSAPRRGFDGSYLPTPSLLTDGSYTETMQGTISHDWLLSTPGTARGNWFNFPLLATSGYQS